MLLGRREVRLQAVVILLRDRLELVVVAAGTARRSGREGVPMMSVRSVRTSLRLKAISGLPAFRRTGPEPVEDRGGQALPVVRVDLIPGDLLDHETVERLVAVECSRSHSRGTARRRECAGRTRYPSVSANRTTSSQCCAQRSP